MESAGCRVQLKSPPSKVECESADSKAGSSVRKKHSLCVLFDVPDGAYTFMWRVPWNSVTIARTDGILSICVIRRSFLAMMALPLMSGPILVCARWPLMHTLSGSTISCIRAMSVSFFRRKSMSIPTRVGDRMPFILMLAILITCMLYLMRVIPALSCEFRVCLCLPPCGLGCSFARVFVLRSFQS